LSVSVASIGRKSNCIEVTLIRLVFKTLSGARDITRGENLRRDQIVSMQIETLRHGVAERAGR
jgi:hypothetical protein